MKKKPGAKGGHGERPTPFPPTSMRIDPELLYRIDRLKAESRREGRRETTSEIVSAALLAYLRERERG